MQDVKLVVCDLDGTLLNSDHLISDYSKETIELLMDKGITFVPCTGRDFKNIPEYFRTHDKIQYLIGANGSQIFDVHNDKLLHEFYLSKEEIYKVLEVMPEMVPNMILTTTESIYITQGILDSLQDVDDNFREFLMNNRIIVDDFMPLIEQATHGVPKLDFDFIDPQHRLDTYKKLQELDFISITSSHFRNLEVTHKNATKGHALNILADLLNIDLNHTMAFGDNDNDASMMKIVKYPIAMANATELLKQHAKYTAPCHNEDGVAQVLRQHILNDL